MDFRKALTEALKICGEQAADPILFYYALCDMVGNDLLLKPQVEAFHSLNKMFLLVETLAHNPEPRTIGELLEKCQNQPDAPRRVCLKWIHTIFEFYYRAKHVNEEQSEQLLQSLAADQSFPPFRRNQLPFFASGFTIAQLHRFFYALRQV